MIYICKYLIRFAITLTQRKNVVQDNVSLDCACTVSALTILTVFLWRSKGSVFVIRNFFQQQEDENCNVYRYSGDAIHALKAGFVT